MRQEVLIEALDTTVLFGASFVESVKGSFVVVQMDGMWGLYLPFPSSARFQYSVRSIPGRLREDDRAATSFIYPVFIREHYLQLPDTSSRVAALAREVTSAASTPYGRARAIEQHLRRSYQYSLDVGTTASADPVEDFLFARKTGYCEHYATAMVVMLRTLGIPSRLVTGFLPGAWNDFGNYYTIRQQDAHAWVEVYFPRSGWVTFDPTPSVPAAAPSLVWWNIDKIVDSIRLRWDRYVVQYSFRDQMAVAKSLRDQSERVRSEVSDFVSTVTRGLASARAWLVELARVRGWTLAIGLAAGAFVIGMVLAVILRGQGRRQRQLDPRTPRQVAASQLYSRMLRILKARGLQKSPGATPLEFARQVAREWRDAAPFVRPLTDLYCQVRFGQASLSSAEAQKVHDLLARLRAVRR
jgi:transglutaminase-like putative cysteine protease